MKLRTLVNTVCLVLLTSGTMTVSTQDMSTVMSGMFAIQFNQM